MLFNETQLFDTIRQIIREELNAINTQEIEVAPSSLTDTFATATGKGIAFSVIDAELAGDLDIDSSGEVYDPDIHDLNRKTKKDGTWCKRRGVKLKKVEESLEVILPEEVPEKENPLPEVKEPIVTYQDVINKYNELSQQGFTVEDMQQLYHEHNISVQTLDGDETQCARLMKGMVSWKKS